MGSIPTRGNALLFYTLAPWQKPDIDFRHSTRKALKILRKVRYGLSFHLIPSAYPGVSRIQREVDFWFIFYRKEESKFDVQEPHHYKWTLTLYITIKQIRGRKETGSCINGFNVKKKKIKLLKCRHFYISISLHWQRGKSAASAIQEAMPPELAAKCGREAS